MTIKPEREREREQGNGDLSAFMNFYVKGERENNMKKLIQSSRNFQLSFHNPPSHLLLTLFVHDQN